LYGIDGLIEALDFGLFFLQSFHVIRGDGFPAHLSQNKIEMEEKNLQIRRGILAEGGRRALLISFRNILGQFFRTSANRHKRFLL